jgi:hypothetical protein
MQGLLFRPTDWFLIPMSIIWTLVITYAAAGAWSAPSSDDHVMAVIVSMMLTAMAAVGVYTLIGRFWVDAVRRRHTWYGVTNRRVIIARDWPRSIVRSLDIATLTDVALDEGFSDIGTVRFGVSDDAIFYLMGGNESWPWSASMASPRFERIRGARDVYELITAIRQSPSESTRPLVKGG